MSVDHPLSQTGFAQLYFQAAKVRHAELSEFFRKFDEVAAPHLSEDDIAFAIQAASEVHEFLDRAGVHLRQLIQDRDNHIEPEIEPYV